MSRHISGIHHITAIAGDPQMNLNFYVGLLGLRLVKLTVNFDDPGTYHLYYGDGLGQPGTILTFFPWPKSPKGRHGTGQVTETSFAIPLHAAAYWTGRLADAGVSVRGPFQRFGEQVLSFSDPDGMVIQLIESSNLSESKVHAEGPVPAAYAIHGFHSATLSEEGYRETAALLTKTLGFTLLGEEENRFRYSIASGGPAAIVDVLCAPEQAPGRVAVGAVHHIAWRTADDQSQREWLNTIGGEGFNVSPVMDRKYFHSIYFREPGNVLFEIATDPPGFTVDEPLEQLGRSLVLPPWLERSRKEIEAVLPPLKMPDLRNAAL